MLTCCQLYCECRNGVGGAPLRVILPKSKQQKKIPACQTRCTTLHYPIAWVIFPLIFWHHCSINYWCIDRSCISCISLLRQGNRNFLETRSGPPPKIYCNTLSPRCNLVRNLVFSYNFKSYACFKPVPNQLLTSFYWFQTGCKQVSKLLKIVLIFLTKF